MATVSLKGGRLVQWVHGRATPRPIEGGSQAAHYWGLDDAV
jgi:hypothetical protein